MVKRKNIVFLILRRYFISFKAKGTSSLHCLRISFISLSSAPPVAKLVEVLIQSGVTSLQMLHASIISCSSRKQFSKITLIMTSFEWA